MPAEGGAGPTGWLGRGATLLAAALLPFAAARFVLELRLVRESCCYDFPALYERVAGYMAGRWPLYAVEVESYAPGVGDFKHPPLRALAPALGAWAGWAEAPLGFFLALDVLVYLAALVLLARAFRITRSPLAWLVFLLVTLDFAPAFETLLRLQGESTILLCLAAAALALRQEREAWAGLGVTAAAAVKLYPALLLLAFVRRPRALAAAALGAVALGLASLALLGPGECAQYFLRAVPVMAREPPIETFRAENAGLARWLVQHAGQQPLAARQWSALLALAMLVVALAAAWPKAARAATPAALAVLVPIALVILPNSWANYQLLLLVPLAAILGAAAGTRRAATAVGLGSAALLVGAWLAYSIDADHYPLWLHLPPWLARALQETRVFATLLTWLGSLAALRVEAAGAEET